MNSLQTPRRPRRLLMLGAAAVAASVLLTGCAGGIGGGGGTASNANSAASPANKKPGAPGTFDKGSTMATIQTRGKLLVGVVEDAAPFSSQDPQLGGWGGFDIELAKQIATGIFGTNIEGKVEFIPVDARDRELALEQNKIDIALGRYDISIARKRFVDFAGPYYEAKQDAVATKASKVASLAALNGRIVCTVQGSTNVDALKAALPSANVSVVKNTPQECAALMTTLSVDAIVADHVDMLNVEQDSASTITKLNYTYGSYFYGVGIHKGTTDLREYVNDVIENWQKWNETLTRTTKDTGATQPPVDRY